MPRLQVAVTGFGMVSALGWSAAESWSSLEAGRSGLGPLTLFPSSRCGHVAVGEVKGECAGIDAANGRSRSVRFALHAARSAFQEAGLSQLTEGQRRGIAVVLGACTGGMLETEAAIAEVIRNQQWNGSWMKDHPVSAATEAVAKDLGVGRFRATVSTACSSGAMAICAACDLIEAGEADIALAGGVDSLTRLTLNGFCSLLLVAPDGCRPFDAQRRGMSLGEGAGVLVLERADSAEARGASVHGWIAGWANTCDAWHVTSPSPDGRGIFRAMSAALAQAGLRPDQVDYLNAHGTGTIGNDLTEAAAITALFGDRPLPVSSTKRFFGHTLAAAGAIEAIVCLQALRVRRAPANLGLNSVDPGIAFEPVRLMRHVPMNVALSNSLGFGGTNCALVICRERSA